MIVQTIIRQLLFCSIALPILAGPTISILTTDGRMIEGEVSNRKVTVRTAGQVRDLQLDRILSIHTATPPTPTENEQIAKSIQSLQGIDRKEQDLAVETISNIGFVAMTSLLKAYKDTDQHEPKPLYRLFDRLIPTGADSLDRSLSVIRIVGGEVLRGNIVDAKFQMAGGNIGIEQVRRLAVRQKLVTKKYDVHSLRHSTQIEYLDSGVMLTSGSTVAAKSRGVVRLSWDVDGWASDADGIKVPGPNYKTNLVDGFPFGGLVGRVGVTGDVWMAGVDLKKKTLPFGRLYFAVNDNKHWQNNIGGFQMELNVTDAYDIGAPQ